MEANDTFNKDIACVVKDPNVEDHYSPSEEMKEPGWVTDAEIYEEAKAIPTLISIQYKDLIAVYEFLD